MGDRDDRLQEILERASQRQDFIMEKKAAPSVVFFGVGNIRDPEYLGRRLARTQIEHPLQGGQVAIDRPVREPFLLSGDDVAVNVRRRDISHSDSREILGESADE